MITQDYKVWIGVEQRLDGLTSRYGPDAYVSLTLIDPDKTRTDLSLSVDLAKKLARGLTKATKQAAAL